MRYDIRNMNIWKQTPEKAGARHCADDFRNMKIEELNLSVRAFNSLKRAECHTVGGILTAMEDSEQGLRKFRNLGARSEAEIKEKLEEAYREFASQTAGQRTGNHPDCRRGMDTGLTPEQTGSLAGEAQYTACGQRGEPGVRIMLRPARSLWAREIGEFHLSDYAENRLRSCGVNRIGDLYATHPRSEPGWYAVRELFRKIAEYS